MIDNSCLSTSYFILCLLLIIILQIVKTKYIFTLIIILHETEYKIKLFLYSVSKDSCIIEKNKHGFYAVLVSLCALSFFFIGIQYRIDILVRHFQIGVGK